MNKKLKNTFMTAAACVMTAFSGAALAHKPMPAPHERSEMIFTDLKTTETGVDSLGLLERHGIKTILVEPQRLLKGMPCADMTVVGSSVGNRLLLNEILADIDLAITIMHESKHTWQLRDIGATMSKMDTPRRAVLLSLMREADSFAHEMHFIYEYEKTTGKTIIRVPDSAEGLRNLSSYDKTYAFYKISRDSGMPLEAAYRSLLRNTLEFAHSTGYAGKELERLEEEARSGEKTTKAPLPDAEFAGLLRKMGTIGFDTVSGPNIFNRKTDAEVLSFVSNALSPEIRRRIENLEAGVMPPRPRSAPTCGS